MGRGFSPGKALAVLFGKGRGTGVVGRLLLLWEDGLSLGLNKKLVCEFRTSLLPTHRKNVVNTSFRIPSHLWFADFHRNPVFSPWAPPPPPECLPLGVGYEFKASAGVTTSGRFLGPRGRGEERVLGRRGGGRP